MSYVEMRDIASRTRGRWFTPEAKRFFRSRWSSYGIETRDKSKVYFVSSERFDDVSPRLYTVRVYNVVLDVVKNVGDFQQYATRSAAWRIAEQHALSGRDGQ